MEDTLNSTSDKERDGGILCAASSSASNNNGIRISVSSRGGVNYQQGDGDESQDERCQRSEPQINACARIKHKTTVRKQYKNRMKRRLHKCRAQSAKEQKSVSEICFGSVAMSQEPAHVTNLGNCAPVFVSQPVPNTGGKEHVIDEDDTDTEEHYARDSRPSNPHAIAEVTLSDLWNDFPLRDNSPPSRDIDREVPDYVQSGTQNNSSYLTPSNRAEYFFAPFLNNQITLGPEERNFCAQNEDDIKLLQILRFIKSCDGALGLLWNFIREHVELFCRQEANVAREENEEGREPEEDYVAEVRVYDEETDIDSAQSDEGQLSEYEDEEEHTQTDYQEQTQVEYQIFDEDGDISEASIEVTEEDSDCDYTDISEEEEEEEEYDVEVNSAEDGDEEATAHNDTESDSDTGTYNEGEVYPYEEIEDDLNEEEDRNGTQEDGNDGDVSGTNDEFRGEFDSVSFGDISELISSFTLSSIDTSESEDDVGDTRLLWERNSVKMVSVGIQTGGSENCEEYSSVAQTFRNKSGHKQRTPYSIPITPPARKMGRRWKGYPYKGVAYRYRPRAKEEKVFILRPEEECGGEKSYTDGDSNTSSENDTHCRGDSCHIIKQLHDVKQYQDRLEEDFKGGDMGGLQVTPGLCENAKMVLSKTGTEAENKYVDAEAKGFNVEEEVEIPVDTSCQTVSGSPLTPETDQNEEEADLATGVTQIRLTENLGTGKNIPDSTLQSGGVNDIEGENPQGTGKQGCPVWQILRRLECPFKWVPDIFIRQIPNSRIQENIIAHLTEKEKEFARANCNIFREVVIHLVLVYEKTLEDRLMEAIADLQHCYTLLGNPQIVMPWTNTEELNLSLVRGNYHFNEMKCKRMNLLYNADENVTEEDPSIENDIPCHEDCEILKISNPPKHIARGQVGSPNSELMVTCTRVETVDQAVQVENITEAKEYQKDGLSKLRNDIEIPGQFTLTVINSEDRDGKVEFCVSEVTKCPDTEFKSNQPLHKDKVVGSGFEDMCRKISVDMQNKKLSQFKEIESKMNGRNFDNEKDENVNVCATENDSERQRSILQVQSRGVHVAPEDFTHAVQKMKNEYPNYVQDCCVAVSGTDDVTVGSFELNVKDISCNGRVMDCKYCSTSSEENKSNPEPINAERNEETFCNHKHQDDATKRTMKDSEKEKSVGEDGKDDRQMQRRAALEYVVNATLAHVAYFSESSQEAYKLVKFIEHTYEQLGHAGKATVAAIRGAMLLEYGYAGNQLGLQYLQKALKLDPEYWEWNLYCGKVLSRVRRVENCKGGEPGLEELSLLEKAVELNQEDASALVHLANAYRAIAHFKHRQKMEAEVKAGSVVETRHYVRFGGTANWRANWSQSRCSQQQEEQITPFQRWRNPQHIPLPRSAVTLEADEKDYLQLAKELFLKALKMEPHCPYNNARCAKGLWSMPFPYKEKERAKEAILHALTLAPDDSLVNHFAGGFYEFCHDYEKALFCYERATLDSKFNYPAEMNYINLKMKISPQGSYSPVFRLDKLVSKYRNPSYMLQIFCHRGLYLYKVEKQYFQAIRNIATAIKIDPGSQTLKTFYPGNFYGRNLSYNMYDLLETMAAEYEELPEGLENKDFVEETLRHIRCLREENCKQNDKCD